MMQVLLEIYQLKKRLVLAVGTLMVLNIVLFAVINHHLLPAVVNSQTKWNDLRGKVALAGQGDVSAAYQQGKIDLETLRGRMPLKREFPRVLNDIVEAAAASGVTTGKMSYKPQSIKEEHLLAYAVTMSVGGNYASLKSFLSDLLKNREIVVVDGLGLANTDPFEESVTMDLKLTVYLREGK